MDLSACVASIVRDHVVHVVVEVCAAVEVTANVLTVAARKVSVSGKLAVALLVSSESGLSMRYMHGRKPLSHSQIIIIAVLLCRPAIKIMTLSLSMLSLYSSRNV